jgi:hypothetical protein
MQEPSFSNAALVVAGRQRPGHEIVAREEMRGAKWISSK